MCDTDNLKLNHQELLQEITALLATSAEPNDANALRLNQELQRRLEQVRDRILKLLQLVRERYSRNEQILIRRQKPRSHSVAAGNGEVLGRSGAVLRGGTFRFKGNLYFRDEDGRSCPNNEDYVSRCDTEMFPTDFDMRSKHVWTVLDKKNVVMGIKQQLLDHATYQAKATKGLCSSIKKRKFIDLHVQSLARLLGSADNSFSIDWHQISTLDLEHRHSSYSCEAMWLVYLHPQLKRTDWTADEDKALLAAAKWNKLQNWQAIADAVKQRSDYQCFVRMQTTLRFHLEPTSTMKWTHDDNKRLCAIVSRNTVNGVTNWAQVVEHFPGRSRSTVIGRYLYGLHPSISHAPFTPSEDLMLFAAVEEYNGKFNCFPRTLFPNRSLVQLRTRYHNVLAQRNKTASWSIEDDTKLMGFITKHGTSEWVKCANHLGNHTRTSCRTRFLVIKRFLEQHPDSTVADIPRRKIRKKETVTADNWEQRLQEWQENPESLHSNPLNKSKAKRVKRKTTTNGSVIEPLSGMDYNIYEYFKYAYNLSLHTAPPTLPLPRNESNLHVVANALRYRPMAEDTDQKPVQSIYLSRQLNRCYNKMLRQFAETPQEATAKSPMLLPPNWSTMMGFRAMCILSVHCRNNAKLPTDSNPPITYDESQPAVQLFRQRLRTLFYNTTLLSRLEPTAFEQLPAALNQLPRPTVNYCQPEKTKSTSTAKRVPPHGPQKTVKDLGGMSAEEVALQQLADLDRMTQTRRSLKSEVKDEPSVKQEVAFE